MSNPHSKTPGGQQASDKFMKQQAESTYLFFPARASLHCTEFEHRLIHHPHLKEHGEGAANSAGHTAGSKPGEAPVASDSGSTNVGIDNSATNVPGEKGISGVPVDSTSGTGANMK